jgi:ATP-dependent RNA helicase DDX46/PRP5
MYVPSPSPLPSNKLTERTLSTAFAEKVKEGKASGAVSGFGGKGLERLDNDRDAHSRAERAAYGETPGEKKAEEIAATIGGAEVAVVDVADLEVEIKKGRAPEPNRKATAASVMDAVTIANMRAAEAKAIAQGFVPFPPPLLSRCVLTGTGDRRTPAGIAKAQSVIANFNAMLKAKTQARSGENDLSTDSARRRDPIATDYHVRPSPNFDDYLLMDLPPQAIIYINDYPQKARWKVTNKETMVQVRPLLLFPLHPLTNPAAAGREHWSVHHEQGNVLRAR